MRRGTAAFAAAVMLLVAGCDRDDGERPGPRVSAAEQQALGSLRMDWLALCPTGEDSLPGSRVAQARRQYAALVEALRAHPDHIVRTSYALSERDPGEAPIQHRDLSVRDLALGELRLFPGPRTGSAEMLACRERVRIELGPLIGPAAELVPDAISGPP